MRLLVVGKLNGQLSNAVKMAMTAGAKVSHVETIEAATHALRAGKAPTCCWSIMISTSPP